MKPGALKRINAYFSARGVYDLGVVLRYLDSNLQLRFCSNYSVRAQDTFKNHLEDWRYLMVNIECHPFKVDFGIEGAALSLAEHDKFFGRHKDRKSFEEFILKYMDNFLRGVAVALDMNELFKLYEEALEDE